MLHGLLTLLMSSKVEGCESVVADRKFFGSCGSVSGVLILLISEVRL